MNAKQMIAKLDGYGGIIPFNSEELDVTLRALRLLAAAEANDGNCPETEAAMCRYTGGEPVTFPKGLSAVVPYSFAANLERERNGLAARVRELEQFHLERQSAEYLDAERYRYLRDRADENSDGPIICSGLGDNFDFLRGPECDEEIDAARSKP